MTAYGLVHATADQNEFSRRPYGGGILTLLLTQILTEREEIVSAREHQALGEAAEFVARS